MKRIFLILTLGYSTLINAQNVGIGETNPANKLSVKGTMSIGSGYSTTAAPADGAIVQGNVGIGIASPASKLDVAGNINSSVGFTISGAAAAGTFLRANGSNFVASALTLPNSATAGDLLYATGTNTIGNLSDAATGNVLLSGGAGAAPSYGKVSLTTAVSGTLPIANGGTGITSGPTAAGQYLRSSGSGTWAVSTIQAGDVPTGSGNYIQNSSSQQASSTFNISGAGVIGTTLAVNGTTASTSTGTGAVVVAGGIGVAGNEWLGGNLYMPNNNNTTTNRLYMAGTDLNHYIYSTGTGGNNMVFGEYTGFTFYNTNSASNVMTINGGTVAIPGLSGTGNRPVMANSSGTLNTVSRSGTASSVYTSSGTYTVPAGVYQVYVEVLGAGGGAAYCSSNCGGGGGGGGVSGMLPVTPGESLTITVGGGGFSQSSGNSAGGGGGGGSAIYRSGTLLCAGGGGGGGSYNSTGDYGQGGGMSGLGSSINGGNSSNNSGGGGSAGNNNVDYLYNAISVAGNNDYSQWNFYNYAGFVPSGGGNYPYGRGGRKSYNSPGTNGIVLIYY